MTRFKLLKDLPGYTAGTVFEYSDVSFVWLLSPIRSHELDQKLMGYVEDLLQRQKTYPDPDWFQPIDDKPERWRAEDGGVFWYMDDAGAVGYKHDEYWMTTDEERHKIGNYFRTEQQASKAAEALKAVLAYIQTDFEPEYEVQFKDGKWAGSQESALLETIGKARKAVQEGRE